MAAQEQSLVARPAPADILAAADALACDVLHHAAREHVSIRVERDGDVLAEAIIATQGREAEPCFVEAESALRGRLLHALRLEGERAEHAATLRTAAIEQLSGRAGP